MQLTQAKKYIQANSLVNPKISPGRANLVAIEEKEALKM